MKLETPWWAKLVIGMVMISSTIIGSIWGTFEILDLRMDNKVKQSEEKVYDHIDDIKTARDNQIVGMNNTLAAKFDGLNARLDSMDSKINLLIGMGRRRVLVEQTDADSVTSTASKREGDI